jgi:hypothetical protein
MRSVGQIPVRPEESTKAGFIRRIRIGLTRSRPVWSVSGRIGWPIVIIVAVLVAVWQVGRVWSWSVRHVGRIDIFVKKAVGFRHPNGLLIVSLPWAGSFIECLQIAVASIWEVTVSVSRASPIIHAIYLYCIPRYTGTRIPHSRGPNEIGH